MAGDISNYGRMKNIYNYPNDVQFNDGHYILFNISMLSLIKDIIMI